jgi:hypothetical protein
MALPSSLPKINITGNSIDMGTYYDGVSVSNYSYDSAMLLNGSANIQNNLISGCVDTSTAATDLVYVNSASCNFSGNQFVRGSGPLNAYINIAGTNDQIITGNVFDSSEVDTGDEGLVKNLTENSTYNNNKNQFGYLAIDIYPYLYNSDQFSVISSSDEYMNAYNSGTTQAFAWMRVPVTNLLPKGASIETIKIGIYAEDIVPTSAVDTGGDNSLVLTVTSVTKNVQNISSGTNSILDPKNTTISNQWIDTYSFDSAPLFSALLANSQFQASSINDDINTSTEVSDINATIELNNKLSSGSTLFKISPLVVKYRF